MSPPVNKLEYESNQKLRRLLIAMASVIVGFLCGVFGIAWEYLNLHHPEAWDGYRWVALFPFAMMTSNDTRTDPAIVFVQYPIYGVVIGIFAFCGYFRHGVVVVCIIHIIAVMIAFEFR